MRCAVIAVLCMLPAAAQEIKLPASWDRLAEKASEVVNVTMDASMLQLAGKFLSDKDQDEAKVKKLVTGLKGIYVKSFEFEKEGEYSMADVEAFRSQMKGPGWSSIVTVRSKKNHDNADVYLKQANGAITGVTIIATEPKELTVVVIDGIIDPDQLRELGGHFGVPKVDIKDSKGLKSKDSNDDEEE